MKTWSAILILSGLATNPLPPRTVISLDGTWEIAEGKMDSQPSRFAHTLPVTLLLLHEWWKRAGEEDSVQLSFG